MVPLGEAGEFLISWKKSEPLNRRLELLTNAFATSPNGVSWNEWSENTYIEPGETYGQQEINALRSFSPQSR